MLLPCRDRKQTCPLVQLYKAILNAKRCQAITMDRVAVGGGNLSPISPSAVTLPGSNFEFLSNLDAPVPTLEFLRCWCHFGQLLMGFQKFLTSFG